MKFVLLDFAGNEIYSYSKRVDTREIPLVVLYSRVSRVFYRYAVDSDANLVTYRETGAHVIY